MCHPEVPAGQVEPEVSTREVTIQTGAEQMPATLAVPDRAGGAPVLVVSDIFGSTPFYENLAARLATAGYTALLPEFFFRQGPLPERTREAALARRAGLDENQTQEDLVRAIDWLEEETGARRIGTVGFCMGGTQVLDL